MSDAHRGALRRLADLAGILPGYVDSTGKRQTTSDVTRVLLLHALGFDASTETLADSALRALRRAERERLVAPVRVMRGSPRGRIRVELRLPRELQGAVEWLVTIRGENQGTIKASGAALVGVRTLEVTVPLRQALPMGYYALDVAVRRGEATRRSAQTLIVAPTRCVNPTAVLGRTKGCGIVANLYSLASGSNCGVGDLGDLQRVVDWSVRKGFDFVGVNPLHAVGNRGDDVSPYRPRSRLFYNPIYIDLASVPEARTTARARQLIDSGVKELPRNAALIDYQRAWSLKDRVLRACYAEFERHDEHGPTARGRSFRRYCTERSSMLDAYAAFAAGAAGPRRRTSGREIQYQKYVQFEVDRQLGVVQRGARASGMSIGLYHDLAVGAAPDGFDVHADPDAFAAGVYLGAPPDALARQGQDWQLVPLHPLRLRENGYAAWINLLRANLRHGGALRIDHVMGLARQFWIPAGRPSSEGAYVRFPADELFGVLAAESVRHRAIIVGEDLGTVPRGFDKTLRKWGILSTRLLYFQKDARGRFARPSEYPRHALVTCSTHDHVPLAGFLAGSDLELRKSVGGATALKVHAREARLRSKDGRELRSALQRAGCLPRGRHAWSSGEMLSAVHAFLARTPCVLVGVLLDDLAGETAPVNLPGVGPERFACWRRRMSTLLERLLAASDIAASLRAIRFRLRSPSQRLPRG